MSGSRSNQSDQWDLGQEPGEPGASSESSWGEGSASVLESLKRREQRRDHVNPRHDDDEHPRASASADS
jgi:hypothetical protein